MGFFDFLKAKKNAPNDLISNTIDSFFPNGEKDINAVTDIVLLILKNKIKRNEARNIAVKSVIISRVAKKFDKERLRMHFSGYCLQHFNDNQIEVFHGYLALLSIGSELFGTTPSDIVRQGDDWVIPG